MYFLEKEAQASTNAVTSPTVQGPHGKYSAFNEFGHFKSCPVWVYGSDSSRTGHKMY